MRLDGTPSATAEIRQSCHCSIRASTLLGRISLIFIYEAPLTISTRYVSYLYERSTSASRRVTFVRALVSEPWHPGVAKTCQALLVWRSDLGNRDGTRMPY